MTQEETSRHGGQEEVDPLRRRRRRRRRSRSRSRGAAAQRILQLRLLLVACGTVSLSSRRLSDPFDVSFKDCFDVAVGGDW